MQSQSNDHSKSGRPCRACRGKSGVEAIGCRELFRDIRDLERSSEAHGRVRFYSVDAYVLQHPGNRRNAVNAFHLLRLYWLLHVAGPDQARCAGHRTGFKLRDLQALPFLDPPSDCGSICVEDIGQATSAADHEQRVMAWAKSVWVAWSAHSQWAVRYYESLTGQRQ